MAATNTNTQNLSNLVINKVDSKQTFQQMVTNNLVNPNELYLVQSELEEDSEIFSIEFELEFDGQDEQDITATCNKTLAEIFQAIEDGYLISAQGIVSQDGSNTYINFDYCVAESEGIVFTTPIVERTYVQIIYSQTGIVAEELFLASSNQTLTIGSYTYDGSSAVNIPVYDGYYDWYSQLSM